ncbi:MAG: ABC transporter ATP-binding protein [Candidatus Delongbacteria bacterium]|nr:ABC transporter ATP-binding protein [Candidatus Delongbacteria bacterium]MBN2833556.1 ABC transporter ATP-binding protein [Candidatus Delongbacteria bacterium]
MRVKLDNDSVILLKDIHKFYNLGSEVVKAVDGVNIEIKRGEFIAIMGASGSGKSTLMNILGCLDFPSSGEYYLNKTLVSKMSDDKLASIRNKEIGFIFQTFNLLARQNAIQNVELPLIYSGDNPDVRKNKAIEALNRVGLKGRMNHKPMEMSGGQRQRVAIARALVNKPSLILADEPTGNLDSTTSLEIMSLLKEIHEAGNTIVLVTHEADIAEFADKIVHMKDGKIDKIIRN